MDLNLTFGAVPVERGCGTRVEGGVYLEVGLSPFGVPLDQFLLDPPAPPPADMTVVARGVTLYRRGDTWHVVDHVGEEGYPNVLDMVEEIRRFGASRRLPKTLAAPTGAHPPSCNPAHCTGKHSGFEFLDENSTIILLHRKAYWSNYLEYWARLVPRVCPKADPSRFMPPVSGHPGEDAAVCEDPDQALAVLRAGANAFLVGPNGINDPDAASDPPFCIGLWWNDLEPETVNQLAPAFDGPMGLQTAFESERQMPSFRYWAEPRPSGIKPDYEERIFAILPITRLVVIQGDGADESFDAANASHLPVALVAE